MGPLRCAWLVIVIVVTWQSLNTSYTIEVQRRTGKTAWQTIQPTATGHSTEDEVGRGRHCWRVRYVMPGAPQTSHWTNLACVTVR